VQASYRFLIDRFGSFRRLRGALLYWLAAQFLRDAPVVFMNYGYAGEGPESAGPALLPEDIPDRLPVQLYHRLTADADLEGREILEISCGRGGGASYMMRYRRPASLLGVDRSPRLVEFCRRRHRHPGLRFSAGDAEDLNLADASFDIVVNVEASHCYGSMDRFLGSSRRVVRPGGQMLWADFRPPEKIESLRKEFCDAGWEIELEEDISRNVLRAMEMGDRRWNALIERQIPKSLQAPFRETAGVRGSRIEQAIRHGRMNYLRCVLRRPLGTVAA
jgi:SAM-dependent methyltransferase